MPRCAVTRRVHFNAAHRLHNPARSDDWNRATFGACNLPNYHGHNYELDVTVEGEIDPDSGYVMDLGELKRLVEAKRRSGIFLSVLGFGTGNYNDGLMQTLVGNDKPAKKTSKISIPLLEKLPMLRKK